MRRALVAGILLSTFSASGDPLSLRDALRSMLANDFDVKIANSAVEEKSYLVEKALGDLDFNLSTLGKSDHSETPSASSLDGVSSAIITDTASLTTTLSRKTSFGAEMSVPYTFSKVESNSSYALLPEAYNTSLGVKVTQPLARGFHRSYFVRNVGKAQTDLKIAQEKYGDQVGDNLRKTLGLYLDALRNRHIVRIRQQSVEDAKAVYEAAKAKNTVGKASLIDVLDAESSLQKAHDAQLTASNDLHSGLEQLALKVYGDALRPLEPSEDLAPHLKAPEQFDVQSLIQEAIRINPDLRTSQLSLLQAEKDLKHSEVDQRPDIKFEGSLTQKGLEDNFSESQEQTNKGKLRSYSVGLKWEQPLNRYAAKGEHKIKALRLSQERVKKLQALRNVSLSIKKSVREIETNWKRIAALEKVAEAEREKYTGQQRRYEQGKISVFEMNEALMTKENAELELSKARISYIKAKYELSNSIGRLARDLELYTTK